MNSFCLTDLLVQHHHDSTVLFGQIMIPLLQTIELINQFLSVVILFLKQFQVLIDDNLQRCDLFTLSFAATGFRFELATQIRQLSLKLVQPLLQLFTFLHFC